MTFDVRSQIRTLFIAQRDPKGVLAIGQLLERAFSDLRRASLWVAARLPLARSIPT